MTDDLTMDQEVIHRLKSACERGLREMPDLAAPDGTISVRIADAMHLLSMHADPPRKPHLMTDKTTPTAEQIMREELGIAPGERIEVWHGLSVGQCLRMIRRVLAMHDAAPEAPPLPQDVAGMIEGERGPFTAGRCDVWSEHPEEHDGAAVFAADGEPFVLIGDDLAVGGDALPRATALAAMLNAALPQPASVDLDVDEQALDIERGIRIAIWNAGKWQGKPDEVAQSLIRKAMAEPPMVRALAAIRAALVASADQPAQTPTPKGE